MKLISQLRTYRRIREQLADDEAGNFEAAPRCTGVFYRVLLTSGCWDHSGLKRDRSPASRDSEIWAFECCSRLQTQKQDCRHPF